MPRRTAPTPAVRAAAAAGLAAVALVPLLPGTRAAAATTPVDGVGSTATVTTSAGRGAALTDGRPTASADDVGTAWTVPAGSGAWAQLSWSGPQNLAGVQFLGTTSAATVGRGTLTFSDGSSVPVGSVLTDPRYPTTLAFPARKVSWVRFTVADVVGSGDLSLAELRAYPVGTTPLRFATPQADVFAADPVNPACTPFTPSSRKAGAVYLACPQVNSRVQGSRTLTFTSTGLTEVAVTAWSAEPGTKPLPERGVKLAADGSGSVTLDFSTLPNGPLTVRLRGTKGASVGGQMPTYAQFVNTGSSFVSDAVPAPSRLAAGRTLVYDEEFNDGFSYSTEGRNPSADYAAAKPEPGGTSQFGDAIFITSKQSYDNVRVTDRRYLRFQGQPLAAGQSDPSGWGRRYMGGLLASGRPGGSGFAAQYGYFEARMLLPAAAGTWPAFWTLPAPHVTKAQPRIAELDALEHYGHNPQGTCHTTHSWHADGSADTEGAARCNGSTFGSAGDALRWRTFGMLVKAGEIVYTVDGNRVAVTPQVTGGGEPMFWMVNLALGGGWPVDLDPIQGRPAVYVDYVRVYV